MKRVNILTISPTDPLSIPGADAINIVYDKENNTLEAITHGGGIIPITTNRIYSIKATPYNLTINDRTVEVTTSGATQTLSAAIGVDGLEYRIINVSNGIVRVTTILNQLIGNNSSETRTYIDLQPEEWLDVISNNQNWRII